MFKKSLPDLIRGIRSHQDDETKYISTCMDECRKELRSSDLDVKANAVSKLTYLQMLGYDISWAAFNIVEVMTSKRYTHKRIGYLAAAQSFHAETDVLMLTTNMLKKSLGAKNMYEVGLALNGLSNFMTPDLARDLGNDIITLMTSVRPYVRKKATLCTYPLFLNFPEALRPAFPRLKDKLEDPEPAVQSASVSVICELARKNPKNYLSLAPTFFKILNNSQNNWMRIKIIKLFAALCPLEPRLAKKLIEPLTDLINSTPAMSLLYECIQTVLTGIKDHTPTIQLCVQKLRIFIEDHDQNLKYLGLQAMADVLKIAPKAVLPHRDLIVECLEDRDESIRLRALDLLAGMVNKKTLVDIVRKLLQHLEVSDGLSYRDEVVGKIIEMASQGHYQYVTDFQWYVQVLIQLTRVEGTRHGKLIASQLMDVAIRVKSIRSYATKQMAALLTDPRLYSGGAVSGISEVLYAAAYVSGEYAEHLDEPQPVLEALLQPRVEGLPGHVQAVYIHNTLKIYASAVKKHQDGNFDEAALATLLDIMTTRLPLFVQSGDLEVQERAVWAKELAGFLHSQRVKGEGVDHELLQLFDGELNPVAAKAQRKVPVPEGLDLEAWINTPPASDDEEEEPEEDDYDFGLGFGTSNSTPAVSKPDSDDEETKAQRRRDRLAAQQSNPYHLGEGSVQPAASAGFQSADMPTTEEIEDIPIAHLDVDVPLKLDVQPTFAKKKKKKKLSKKEKKALKKKGLPIPDEDDSEPEVKVEIQADEEMPEGAAESDHEDDDRTNDDPHRALDINLDDPMDASDLVLPTPTHHVASGLSAEEAAALERQRVREERKKKKADKKKKKKKSKHADAEAGDAEDDGHVHEHGTNGEVVVTQDEPGPDDESGAVAAEAPAAADTNATTSSSSKPKKAKKAKKSKKSKKSKAAAPQAALALKPLVKDEAIAAAYDVLGNTATGQLSLTLILQGIAAEPAKLVRVEATPDSAVALVAPPVTDPLDIAQGTQTQVVADLTAPEGYVDTSFSGQLVYSKADGEEVIVAVAVPITLASYSNGLPCDQDTFAAKLAGEDLIASESLTVESDKGFQAVVGVLCQSLRLAGVEYVEGAASMFATMMDGAQAALLVKAKEGSLAIDVKATSVGLKDALHSSITALLAA